MRRTIALKLMVLSAATVFTGCTSSEKPSTDTVAAAETEHADRDIANASVGTDKAYLIFYSSKVRRDPNSRRESVIEHLVEAITPYRWKNYDKQGSARRQMMLDFYFANTRELSDSGRRNVACFTGAASEIVRDFFTNVPIDEFENLRITRSGDERLLGVNFRIMRKGRLTPAHFRIPSCTHAGKGVLIDDQKIALAVRKQEERDARKGREPQNAANQDPHDQFDPKKSQAMLDRVPAAVETEGYVINDTVPPEAQGKVPRFVLKADYDKAHKIEEPLPWRAANLNLADDADKMRFALIMKRYLYDGMANQSSNPTLNLNAARADKFWCHMPWLNQGPEGREAVHGLTQERALKPSMMYPGATEGSDWGVAVFNFKGCRAIDRVFGPAYSPRTPPRDAGTWQKLTDFEDGSVIGKFLFTTAAFEALRGAWEIIAHVSPPNAMVRELQPVRHIQLDIGIKDSTLKGVPIAKSDNWIMLTYYYDATYEDDFDLGKNMPVAIKRMRPVGLQWGFAQADSKIFKGAKTNSEKGHLNGPADNIKSSCLGCHGTAGNDVKMAPGVTSTSTYHALKKKGLTLDFGQQFAFAKKNYETRALEAAAK